MITLGGVAIMCAYTTLVGIIVLYNSENSELTRELLRESLMIA
jgi:hypothetical protein